MAPTREDFLARKIQCLEKRLSLIERFVEARFSESLQDFSAVFVPPPTAVAVEPPPPISVAIQPPPPPVQPQPGFSRAAPASVKRKAQEEQVLRTVIIKTERDQLAGVKDCVVNIVRLPSPIRTLEKNSRPSTTAAIVKDGGSIASRARRIRTPVVREDFITETRNNRRRKEQPTVGGGAGSSLIRIGAINDAEIEVYSDVDQDDDEQGHEMMGDTGPSTPDIVDVEETYFEFTETKTERVAISRNSTAKVNYALGDDDEDLEVVEEKDDDWSEAEDLDDDDDLNDGNQMTPKRKRASPRKRGPDGCLPAKPRDSRKGINLATIQTDAIRVNDPNRKGCPVCHIHVKAEKFASHMDSHTRARLHSCKHANCDKSYPSLGALRKHERTHDPENNGMKCRICFKLFSRKDKALDHERLCAQRTVESGEVVDPEIIEDLQRRTKGKWRWAPKIRTHDVVVEEKKECPECKLMFAPKAFESHMKRHKIGRIWSCNICSKSFFDKSGLVRHIFYVHKKDDKTGDGERSENEVGDVSPEGAEVEDADV